MFLDTMKIDSLVEDPLKYYFCETIYYAQPFPNETIIDSYLYSNSKTLFFDIESTESFDFSFDRVNGISWSLELTPDAVTGTRVRYKRCDGSCSFWDKTESYMNSSYWITWDQNIDLDVSYPYWRAGAGHYVDRDDFGISTGSESNFYVAKMNDIVMRFTSYWVDPLPSDRIVFYSQECSVHLSLELSATVEGMLTMFSIGDYINIEPILINADQLNGYIYLYSADISDFHYKLYLLEGNETKLCHVDTNQCRNVSEGILISDLSTYDVNANEYIIDITSDSLSSSLLPITPNQFIFRRNIMMVDVDIILEDAEMGFSIGSLLDIYINYERITQPNATISILFDEYLLFHGDGYQLFIDFYNNSCIILSGKNDHQIFTKNSSNSIYCGSIEIKNMTYKSIDVNAYKIQLTSSDTLLKEGEFSISRKVQQLSIVLSDSAYLGESIQVNYSYVNGNDSQLTSMIRFSSFDLQFAYYMTIDHRNGECTLTDDWEGAVGLVIDCIDGINFMTELHISQQGTISIASKDTEILSAIHWELTIDECPIGYGIGDFRICKECSSDSVNIEQNSECISCDDSLAEGITCNGGDELIVSYNYWVEIQTTSDKSEFITGRCPSSYCCANTNGCDYIQDSQCATNRDPTIPLCGSCLPGYSEIIGMAQCAECNTNNFYYLIYPFVVAVGFVFVLIITDGVTTISKKQQKDYRTLLYRDDFKCMKLAFLRPLLYYYQAISYLTISTGIVVYFEPVAQALSLDFLFVTSTSDTSSSYIKSLCFYNGLTALAKQLLSLVFPCFMFMALALLGLLGRLFFRYCGWKLLKMDKNNVMSVLWSLTLIAMGTLLSKCFTVLACGQVGSATVHFYAGYLKCYETSWWIAVIILIFIITFWIFIGIRLYQMDPDLRAANLSSMRQLTKGYKPTYWHWELILISRRIVISFMITFSYLSPDFCNLGLLTILSLYLLIQIQFKPFRYKIVNRIEGLCLLLLIIALGCIICDIDDDNTFASSFIMSFIIMLPFVVFIICCLFATYNHIQLTFGDKDELFSTPRHMTRIQSLNTRINNFQRTASMNPSTLKEQHNVNLQMSKPSVFANKSDVEKNMSAKLYQKSRDYSSDSPDSNEIQALSPNRQISTKL